MKVRRWLAASAAALSLVLTGCTSDSDDAATFSPPPASAINTHERTGLRAGGELRLSTPSYPASFNPLAPGGANPSTRLLTSAILPSFFTIAPDGTAKPNPDFVTSAEAKGQPTVLTVKINPKATWGDGTPITAADVIATFQACSGAPAFTCAGRAAFRLVAKVEQGADAREIVVTYTNRTADWAAPFLVVGTLKASVAKSSQVFNSWTQLDEKLLAGPFTIDAASATGGFIALKPNPKWWGKKPLLSRVSFHVVDPKNQFQALADAKLDAVTINPTAQAIDAARAVPDVDVRVAAQPAARSLVLNTKAEPLNDQAVRQAILAALDRHAIAAKALDGLRYPAHSLNSQIYTTSQAGYRDMAEMTKLTYDVNRAKSALDEAGWKVDEAGKRAKDGKPMALTLTVAKDDRASIAEGEQIRGMLAQAGIQVTLAPVDAGAYAAAKPLRDGSFQMMVLTEDRIPFAELAAVTQYGAQGTSWSRFVSDEVNKLLDAGTVDAPGAKRADEFLWKATPTIPLYQPPQVVAINTRIANFGALGTATPDWANVGYVK